MYIHVPTWDWWTWWSVVPVEIAGIECIMYDLSLVCLSGTHILSESQLPKEVRHKMSPRTAVPVSPATSTPQGESWLIQTVKLLHFFLLLLLLLLLLLFLLLLLCFLLHHLLCLYHFSSYLSNYFHDVFWLLPHSVFLPGRVISVHSTPFEIHRRHPLSPYSWQYHSVFWCEET